MKKNKDTIPLITKKAPYVPLFKPIKKSKQMKIAPTKGYTPPLLFLIVVKVTVYLWLFLGIHLSAFLWATFNEIKMAK